MIVETKAGKLKVGWRYDEKRRTHCIIQPADPEQSTPRSYGVTECSAEDNFNRNIGRKISFQRAVSWLFSKDKNIRKQLWEAFHQNIRNSKVSVRG